ncbi:MHYT domain-containing protein [Caulobacter mirabilis]|uniref:histidine kinase n=1 Tax=Caulobacter mirabilis TaxID=69666 RepID=A0A2D2B268_9CAUL|nr:MHYT domain-containing protein [Caulobacter mirabilis]ATQ44317.1 sensor histidine kinase [Caulobacter mirabilis]
MHSEHQAVFVVVAMVVAVFGSWTALDLFRRVRANVDVARLGWLAAAAAAMGLSIWSMHFVAMLGFQPPVSVRYDVGLTLLSLFIAMATTALAFFVGSSGVPGRARIVLTGLAMGLGICAMHYTGMAALRSSMPFSYDPAIVALSYLVAAAASIGALFAASRDHTRFSAGIAALALGGGIVAMHYTGMAAMRMAPHEHTPSLDLHAPALPPIALALAVATGTLLLLGLTLVAAVFDRRHEAVTAREAETLRSSRAQLRAVLEQMPIGVLVAEAPSGRIIFGNAQAEALLGAQGERLEQLDGDGRPVDTPMEWALLGQTVSRERRQHQLADGQTATLEISATPVRDAEGYIALAVLTVQDVTAQIEAEEALSQAQKLDSLGRLTGGVAHDFNNLLTAVIGSLELAARRVDDERALRLIGNAGEAAQRGARLTAQLLAFSRRQKLESRAVDLNGLITRMGDLLASTLGGTIRVEFDLASDLPPAMADPMQLELALLNLAINARDAMPGGGALTFSTAQARVDGGGALEPKPGHYVSVSVTDTGDGMTPEVLAKAVDPFFTTKPAGRGSGLGLSQVVGLVRQLGGGATIRSAPGEGASVTLYLPRAQAPIEVASSQRSTAAATARSGAVMVVDDDDDVRRLVSELLTEAGHQVIASDDGAEALERLHAGVRPDVLLVDYAMPGLNGAEVIRRARALHPNLPVLMMTGYLDHAVLPSDIDEDIVLQKPFEPGKLLDRLADLMPKVVA